MRSESTNTVRSEPTLLKFNPKVIPYQYEVIKLIRGYDYSKGSPEILLSGTVGSAKSVLMAHLVLTHCLQNPGAGAFIGRRSLPDLKKTLWKEILDHMADDLIEGEDYITNKSSMTISFRNGSFILTGSWADKRYRKFRSLKLSCVAIEELTENDDEDRQAVMELKARLRRIPRVKENFMICATNPDAPSHWAYKYFIEPNL